MTAQIQIVDADKDTRDDCLEEIERIGLRVAYFRKVRNMTQAELAAKVNINKNYLSHIECGNANKALSLPLLIKISKALDVKLSVLVDLEDWDNETEKMNEAAAIQELRQMFDEMCQLNADLDKAMEKMDEWDIDTKLVEAE